MPIERTKAADLLTEIVLYVFRLESGFVQAADAISAPAGLTAARWKVLGAVYETPHSVAEIARRMGLTRQGVQRLADILAGEGLCAYTDNPAHKSAKLLAPTAAGRAAIAAIADRQRHWANAVAEGLDAETLAETHRMLRTLIERVEATPVPEENSAALKYALLKE